MIALLLLLAASPPPPLPDRSEARRVIDHQLRSPPREEARLSPEEATILRQRYLDSIGRRLDPEAKR